MDKIKITNHQLFAITSIFTYGSTVLGLASSVAVMAKQDAWLSCIIAIFFGALFIWLYLYLGSLYPDKTYVQVVFTVLGRWAGGVVTIGFVFLCLLAVPELGQYVANFMKIQYMPETPVYVIGFLFVLALVIAQKYGLEAIVRSSEFFNWFISVLFLGAMILVVPKFEANHLLPVLENGIVPVLQGALFLAGFIVFPLITLFMIYPINITDIKKAQRSVLKGYFWGCLLVFLSTFMSIAVLGSTITAGAQFPAYVLAAEINIGSILTRMEGIIAGIWLITTFYRALIYCYSGVVGLAQLLLLKDYKRIIYPLGLIMLILIPIVYPNYLYQVEWDTYVWIPFIGTYAVVLPIVLLLVTWMKRLLGTWQAMNKNE